ncbi:MAG TPA: hypothetical protein VF088_05010 [Pyrinomonadaceae bacterium]
MAPLRRWPMHPPGPHPGHRPIRSGRFYRALWPATSPIVVVPKLADEISAVLEEFAQAAGSTADSPLMVVLRRGTMGLHRSGRAIDIYEVGGKGIGRWAQEWNEAMKKASAAQESDRARIIHEEKGRNLGYKLYKALQARGGWAQPSGYPVQLFGPWTRVEGPHKAISDKLLKMHNDHIHVAK